MLTKFNVSCLLALCVAGLSLGSLQPAFASGGDDDDSNKTDLTTCPKGEVWDKQAKQCVKTTGSLIPDDTLTDYAYALAKANRYDEALATLNLLKNPNTAKALNYRGYATRKLGRTDEGIGYYLKAVAIDPGYAQVREYLGEAYVVKGRLDLAKDQLATIKTICGTGCEEYEDLSKAISDPSTI